MSNSSERSWYAVDTNGSKPYKAIGPCINYHSAESIGFREFGKYYSVVKTTTFLARHKYDVETP